MALALQEVVYDVSSDRDARLARLQQRLNELQTARRELVATLGDAAVFDQAERAAKDALRQYIDAHAAAMLSDHRDALRRMGQADMAYRTVEGCLARLQGEVDYDG